MDSAQGRDTSPAGCKLECWQGHRLHVDLKESVRSEWAPASGLTHTLSESRSRVSDVAGVPASTHPLGYVREPKFIGLLGSEVAVYEIDVGPGLKVGGMVFFQSRRGLGGDW